MKLLGSLKSRNYVNFLENIFEVFEVPPAPDMPYALGRTHELSELAGFNLRVVALLFPRNSLALLLLGANHANETEWSTASLLPSKISLDEQIHSDDSIKKPNTPKNIE